jgi:hypothetical protein
VGNRAARLDGEDQLAGAAAVECESQLKIVIVLNDDPIVAVVVTDIDLLWADLMLGSEVFSLSEESLIVGDHDALDDRALALGCEVEGQLDI